MQEVDDGVQEGTGGMINTHVAAAGRPRSGANGRTGTHGETAEERDAPPQVDWKRGGGNEIN